MSRDQGQRSWFKGSGGGGSSSGVDVLSGGIALEGFGLPGLVVWIDK